MSTVQATIGGSVVGVVFLFHSVVYLLLYHVVNGIAGYFVLHGIWYCMVLSISQCGSDEWTRVSDCWVLQSVGSGL